MERLIYSNSIPTKLHRSSPFLPRVARVDSNRKLAQFSSSWTSPPTLLQKIDLWRIKPLSCAAHDLTSIPQKSIDDGGNKSFNFDVDLANASEPTPHFLKIVAQRLSQQQKVVNAGATILLSAIFLTLLHPAIVSPALASFPATANAGTTLVRSELLNSAWTGFLAGCLHTLSGPDHLAALAPLSIGRTRIQSAAVGALWGCGHDAGQLIFGLLFLILKDRLHIEIFRTWGTRVVGFTLLIIGAMGIKEASEVPALETGEFEVSGGYDTLAVGPKKKIGFTTFATGVVHGLQPDALLIILPALALPSRVAGAAFLGMFLVGTVVAMGSYTVFIGSCSQALKDRVPRITEKLTWASSLIAIALGLSFLVGQSFGFSLY